MTFRSINYNTRATTTDRLYQYWKRLTIHKNTYCLLPLLLVLTFFAGLKRCSSTHAVFHFSGLIVFLLQGRETEVKLLALVLHYCSLFKSNLSNYCFDIAAVICTDLFFSIVPDNTDWLPVAFSFGSRIECAKACFWTTAKCLVSICHLTSTS